MATPALLLTLLVAVSSAIATELTSPRANEVIETYGLETSLRSSLFSTCIKQAASLTGSLWLVVVGQQGFQQVTSSSAQNITWQVADAATTLFACAQATVDAAKLMFKFNGGSCMVAMNGFYDPENQACDGQTVYISLYGNSGCVTPFGGFLDGQNITSDGMCYSTCVGKTVTVQDGTEVAIPSDGAVSCIGTEAIPHILIVTDGSASASFCAAATTCGLLGLELAQVDTEENLNAVMTAVATKPGTPGFWVNVQYIDGAWVHMPSRTPVAADMWDSADTTTCVVIQQSGKLGSAPCIAALPYMCVDTTKTTKPCETLSEIKE
ncbi:uncharacterized protein LOC108673423 [Hyalella azteca]|uniref:Uncharacterized protein LOC108673423 n=1 Tax=Hyalella azteca TaxID=294128 RepID=A0A8B7NSQ0_HYAAZ|nr:uncharacterized protein LOC108673423 [Hyalella azteca]